MRTFWLQVDHQDKIQADGSLDKCKARLVAKGFKQTEGFDHFDTFAPVARITVIRLLIALVGCYP